MCREANFLRSSAILRLAWAREHGGLLWLEELERKQGAFNAKFGGCALGVSPLP